MRFVASSFGRQTTYTLAYDHSDAPQVLRWSLVEGDVLSQMEGSYEFSEVGPKQTETTYSLALDLAVALPGFVQRRAEDKIIGSAIDGLKDRVESSGN